MAYSNVPYYPYQPNYYGANGSVPDMLDRYKYQPMQPMQPMQMPTNDMFWVLGEVEAMSYPVAPNNTVTLWDKNTPTIYIKSVNAQGVPSIRILDFTERTQGAENRAQEHKCACAGKYAPIDEFNAMRENLTALRKEFEEYKKGGAE